MKIILAMLYIIFLFLAKDILSFVLMVIFALVMIFISGIKFTVILKSLKPIVFIMFFTAFFNIFWTTGTSEPLFEYGFVRIYSEGLIFAAKMIVRVICILVGTSMILTYTTSPIALTDGLERLFSPLKKLKFPVHEFSITMTIALRFIPTLIEDTDKIMNAQKARGADFNSGGLIKRAKSLLPVLIPLFASSLRRADELATAMECRCYRGDKGRTRMTKLSYGATDVLLLFVILFFGATIILLNRFGADIVSFFKVLI